MAMSNNYLRTTFRFINSSKNADDQTNFIFPSKQKTFELGTSSPDTKDGHEIMRNFVSRNVSY